MTSINKTKIYSLEALRCLAFFGVFVNHADITSLFTTGSGAWAVSIFIVLSGFLTIYNNHDNKAFINYKIRDCFKYAINKMKKIYPLHIITTVFAFFIVIKDYDIYQTLFTSFKMGLNFLLIQEWIPLFERSINGVSWYLCVTFFSYLITPFVINATNKYENYKKPLFNIFLLFFLQILICYLSVYIKSPPYSDPIFDYDIYNWFIYKLPIVRMIDFLIGCNLGLFFLFIKDNSSIRCTIMEIVSIVISYLTCVYFGHLRSIAITNEIHMICDKTAWYGPTVIFTLNSCLLVYYFAINKGIISKLLTNKIILFIAKLSPYAYLIHSVVNMYISHFIVFYTTNEYLLYYMWAIKLYLGFLITICLSFIYYKISTIRTKKN